jgi:hypothetical protein
MSRASTSPVRRRRPPSRLRFPAILIGLLAFALLPVLALGLPVVKAAIPSEEDGPVVSGPLDAAGTASAGSIGAGLPTSTPTATATGTPTATPVPPAAPAPVAAPVVESPAPAPVPEAANESPTTGAGQSDPVITTTPQPETEPEANPTENVLDASGTDPPVAGGTIGDIAAELTNGAGASAGPDPSGSVEPEGEEEQSGQKRVERQEAPPTPELPTPPSSEPITTPSVTPTVTPTGEPTTTPAPEAPATGAVTGATATGAAAGAAALAAESAKETAQEDDEDEPAPLARVLFGGEPTATPTSTATATAAAEAVATVAGAFGTQAALTTEGEIVAGEAQGAEVVATPTPPSAGSDPLVTADQAGVAALGADAEGCTGGFWDLFSGCAEEEHAGALDCSGIFLKTLGVPFDHCGGGSTAYLCLELGAGCVGGVFESHCDPTEVPGQPLTYPCSNHTAPLLELPIPGADADAGHSGVPLPKGENGSKGYLPHGGGVGVVPDLSNLTDPKAHEYLVFYGLKSITKGRWTVGPSILGALGFEDVDRGGDHEVEEDAAVVSGGFTFDVGTHFQIGKRRFGIEIGGLAYLSGVWAGPDVVAAETDPGWAQTVPGPGPATQTATAEPTQGLPTAIPTATPTATLAPAPLVDSSASSAGIPVDTPTPTATATATATALPDLTTPTPAPAVTEQPVTEQPEQPVTEQPEQPVGELPEEPVGGLPEAAVVPEGAPEVVLLDPVTHLVVGTCADGACGLNRRVAPTTSADVVGVSLDGDTLEIVCQTTGETISNGRASSAIWNRLSDGTWVSDFYVDTPNVGTRSYPAC